MTIDEAIEHAREVAKGKYAEGILCHTNPNDGELDGCIKCAEEHEQLAEWLEELKANRIALAKASKKLDANARLGYSKAIDDFVQLVKKYEWTIRNKNENTFIYGAIDMLAEQLKAGGTDA